MFSENLKFLRKASRMTQQQIADKLNVTRTTVNDWETGKSECDLQSLRKLRELFKVVYEDLLD